MKKLSRISLTVLFVFVVYVSSTRHIDKQCEARIRQAFPDAVCHDDLDPKACDTSCKKQAEVKCGYGKPKQIQKLQCQKRRNGKGLYSCCCKVECKGVLLKPLAVISTI